MLSSCRAVCVPAVSVRSYSRSLSFSVELKHPSLRNPKQLIPWASRERSGVHCPPCPHSSVCCSTRFELRLGSGVKQKKPQCGHVAAMEAQQAALIPRPLFSCLQNGGHKTSFPSGLRQTECKNKSILQRLVQDKPLSILLPTF